MIDGLRPTSSSRAYGVHRVSKRRVTARLLNAWAEVKPQDDGRLSSRICLELTSAPDSVEIGPPRPALNGDYTVAILLKDATLVMAEDDILIADGLLRKMTVRSTGPATAELLIHLEHPVTPTLEDAPGMPHTTRLAFSREALRGIFGNRRIGVDPGHGGRDLGCKGPVNLLEKDTSLSVALELASILKSSGAVPVLTREDDVFVSDASRSALLDRERAELCVQVHATGLDDPMAQSYRLFAKSGCDDSLKLSHTISGAFCERMGIRFDRPMWLDDTQTGRCPTVRVEPLCLTYFSDEANFRAPLFKKRTAQAIYNGIHRFLHHKKRGQPE